MFEGVISIAIFGLGAFVYLQEKTINLQQKEIEEVRKDLLNLRVALSDVEQASNKRVLEVRAELEAYKRSKKRYVPQPPPLRSGATDRVRDDGSEVSMFGAAVAGAALGCAASSFFDDSSTSYADDSSSSYAAE